MRKIKIYLYLNKINGKTYIGQTVRSLHDRSGKDGTRYYSCPLFGNAIKKYGWNNFIVSTLYECFNQVEADYKERFLINLYHSNEKEFGYNISNGGTNGKTITNETKQKISKSLTGKLKGENNPNYGKKMSCETKKKISDAKKGKVHKGYKISEKTKELIRKKNLGKHLSEETKAKLRQYSGKNAVWYGKHHTKETIEKLKSYRGEKSSFFGKKHTNDYKELMSKKMKGKNNPAFGKHWFTNGFNNILSYECPDGYYKGKVRKGGN